MNSEIRVREVLQRMARVPGARHVTGHWITQRLSLELDETLTSRGMLEDLLVMSGYSPHLWNEAFGSLPEPKAHMGRRPTERGMGPPPPKRRADSRLWWTALSWGVAGVLGITGANLLEQWVQPGLDRSVMAPWLHALGGPRLTERHLPDVLLLISVVGIGWGCSSIYNMCIRRPSTRRPRFGGKLGP